MNLTKDTEKEAMRELAWKEFVEAIKPGNAVIAPRLADTLKTKKSKKAIYHPALITSLELGNWELFG